MLERAGLVQRNHGRLEVTPRGARRLGERALTQVFEELRRDREGTHIARDPGGTAEPTGATRPWRFGDTGQIAVQRSVFNAVVRGAGDGTGVRLTRRRLRAGRGRAADRDGDRAPARPVVLDAAARALGAREEDGAGAARADRGPLPARHALHDRVQRLRPPDGARGPHGRRLGAHVRHEHAARVPARRAVARAAPAGGPTGDHGHRRRADRAPRRRSRVLRVAAASRRRCSSRSPRRCVCRRPACV